MRKILAAAVLLFGVLGTVRASVSLVFAGGSGTPLSITLPQPISFTITSTVATGNGPIFLFDEVLDIFNNSSPAVTGNITFSINGGTPITLDTANSGANAGSITPNDLYIYGSTSFVGAATGGVFVLSAGTLTTVNNVAATRPADGSYDAFIVDGDGVQRSTFAVTVPEPASGTFLAAGALALLARRRHERRKAR